MMVNTKDPREISISPLAITNVSPIAIIPRKEICVNRLFIFCKVKNSGEVKEKLTHRRISIIIAPYLVK